MRRWTCLLALLGAVVTALALVPAGTASADTTPAVPHGTWPLRPRPEVVRGFDPPASAWGAGHRGVDLLGSPGQEVRVAAAGVVVFAGSVAGRGVLTVDHGGVRTTYEPVAASVRAGERVRAGEVVGRLQLPMSHCFPRACLHWGLLTGDRYLDPLRMVGLGPVRLLPYDHPPAGQRGRSTPWSGRSDAVDPSGPWVGLPVGLAQAVGGDVGVDLGRGQ